MEEKVHSVMQCCLIYGHKGDWHGNSLNQLTIPAHPEDIVPQNTTGYAQVT
jgi:hypothetical protein